MKTKNLWARGAWVTLAMAALAGPAVAQPPGQVSRDPFKPKTRYRGLTGSPAKRLIELQRRKNLRKK